jgi:hypothetical protein
MLTLLATLTLVLIMLSAILEIAVKFSTSVRAMVPTPNGLPGSLLQVRQETEYSPKDRSLLTAAHGLRVIGHAFLWWACIGTHLRVYQMPKLAHLPNLLTVVLTIGVVVWACTTSPRGMISPTLASDSTATLLHVIALLGFSATALTSILTFLSRHPSPLAFPCTLFSLAMLPHIIIMHLVGPRLVLGPVDEYVPRLILELCAGAYIVLPSILCALVLMETVTPQRPLLPAINSPKSSTKPLILHKSSWSHSMESSPETNERNLDNSPAASLNQPLSSPLAKLPRATPPTQGSNYTAYDSGSDLFASSAFSKSNMPSGSLGISENPSAVVDPPKLSLPEMPSSNEARSDLAGNNSVLSYAGSPFLDSQMIRMIYGRPNSLISNHHISAPVEFATGPTVHDYPAPYDPRMSFLPGMPAMYNPAPANLFDPRHSAMVNPAMFQFPGMHTPENLGPEPLPSALPAALDPHTTSPGGTNSELSWTRPGDQRSVRDSTLSLINALPPPPTQVLPMDNGDRMLMTGSPSRRPSAIGLFPDLAPSSGLISPRRVHAPPRKPASVRLSEIKLDELSPHSQPSESSPTSGASGKQETMITSQVRFSALFDPAVGPLTPSPLPAHPPPQLRLHSPVTLALSPTSAEGPHFSQPAMHAATAQGSFFAMNASPAQLDSQVHPMSYGPGEPLDKGPGLASPPKPKPTLTAPYLRFFN